MRRPLLIVAVAVLVIWSTAPFLWTILTSLKPAREVFAIPPTLLPHEPTLANYGAIFVQRPFGLYLRNSLVVATLSTLLCLLTAAPAAYALARLRLPQARWIERAILAFALFPPAVFLVPLHDFARLLGAIDSHAGLAVVHAALNLPFAVWTLAAFFRELPLELEDAARVDGFSTPGILLGIVLPLSAPALSATALLVFVFSWNEFLLALTLMSHDRLRTVPVGIAMLTGATSEEIPWGEICAAVIVTTAPVVAILPAFQRWIMSGLTAGAVKG